MFTFIKRLIFDIRFQLREWKMQWREADTINLFEEQDENPMAGLIAYKEMQRHHEERVQQHQLERQKIR